MNIKKYLKILISILFILQSTIVNSQLKIDSLENLLPLKKDTAKIDLLNLLAGKYESIDNNKSLLYANQALQLSSELKYTMGKISAILSIGLVNNNIGNYDTALVYFNKGFHMAKKANSKEQMATALNRTGLVYYNKSNFNKALKNYFKALKIFEELNNLYAQSAVVNNIANIFYIQKQLNKAIEYHLKSLKISKELGNKALIAGSYNNLGIIYREKGLVKKALKYYFKTLKIAEEIQHKYGISLTLNNIGTTYLEMNNYEDALKYLLRAIKIKKEIGDSLGIALVNRNIGSIYLKQKKLDKAIDCFNKSINISKQIGSNYNLFRSYKVLSETYEIKHNYKKAFYYYKLFTQIKDSVFNEESNKQITEMQTKYETEKKEKEIALLNKEKQLQNVELAKKQAEVKKKNIQRNAFIGGFVLVLVLVFVVYRGYSQKKRSNQILSEKNILITRQKAELTQTLEELRATQEQLVESEKMASLGNLVAGVAHEINTPVGIGITASSSLVEDTKQFAELYKKDKMSRKALEKFLENTFEVSNLILKNMNRTGELVQSFKQVSVDQMVDEARKFNLKSYLNDIMLSIKPEFKEKTIKVDIDCDKNLELNSIPGAFAQIITNLTLNSIKHGFRERDKGHITITATTKCHSERSPAHNLCAGRSEESSHLLLQYKDNGTGISKENLPKIFDPFFTTNKQIGTGLGLHIVYNLVTQKLKGTVSCESEEGKGVLFTISIPIT